MEDHRSARAALSLLDRLGDLADGDAGADCTSYETVIDAFHGAMSAAVASYCGFELTLVRAGAPLVLTVVVPGASPEPMTSGEPAEVVVRSSLRLPLPVLGEGFEPGSRLVVYAGRPGAWVDLAADVAHLLRHRDGDRSARPRVEDAAAARSGGAMDADAVLADAVVLDADLPARLLPGVEGLEVLVAVERAKGMLIERGHHPDDVDATFTRQAAAARLTPYAFAVSTDHRRDTGRPDPAADERGNDRPVPA